MLNGKFRILLSVLIWTVFAGAGGGCKSTKIVETWRHPELKGPFDFKRTLVVALAPDQYTRNVAEDVIVERIGTHRATAANDLIVAEKPLDREAIKGLVTNGGFDGVVTIGLVGTHRIAGRDEAQGMDEPFYTYYDRAAAFTREEHPGGTDTVYRVETRIYSVKTERLEWSAITDTVNPDQVHDAVTKVAKAVGAELRKQKLVR